MEFGRQPVTSSMHQEPFPCRPWRAAPRAMICSPELSMLHSAFCKSRIWPPKNRKKLNAGKFSWTGMALGASTADFNDSNYNREREFSSSPEKDTNVGKMGTPPRHIGNLQAAGIISGVTALGTLAAVSFTLASGGPAALAQAISKSGFFAAFALIFVSEIGDKTFFIAALLAMRHSRSLVLLGSIGALALMTIISVVIGMLFQRVPAQLQTTLPLGEYAAVALLVLFGIKAIKDAWDLPSSPTKAAAAESGELAEAEEAVKQVQVEKKLSTPMTILGETFSLVFLAEWGDRSMLATVALGAAQSPWGVASGAIVGHTLATLLAVLGGAFLAQYISEKVVGYTGGILFLAFAAATLLGAF